MLSVKDCLYVMLLQSSNQASNALAEYIGGSRSGFVDMMNRKVAELGCQESHFANPSGLNDDTQRTSAYDMALIADVYKRQVLPLFGPGAGQGMSCRDHQEQLLVIDRFIQIIAPVLVR